MKKKNKIAVAYCRTATTDQKGCANPLQQQQDKCLQKAKEDGYKKVKVITEVASGSSLERKGMRALIKLVKENRVDSIYVVDIDRLSRNTIDYCALRKLFERHNVGLKITDSSAAKRLIDGLMAIFQEYERRIRSERIKAGIERKRKLLKSN